MGDKLNWRSELLISFFTFPWIVKKHVRPLTICRKSCHSNCYVNSAAIARIRAVGNVTSSRHAHFCWPEDQNHQHGTQMSASRRKHTELGKVTIRSLLQTPKASERLLCEAICSCVFDYAQLDFDTMVLFLHWILYNVKNSEMLRGSPCVWRELAREREFFFLPDFTFSLTNRAFLFISSPLSSPLYCCVSPLSSHSFSPSDHTHTHTRTHTVHALFLLQHPMACRLKRGQAWLLLAWYQEIPDESPHSCQDSFIKHETVNSHLQIEKPVSHILVCIVFWEQGSCAGSLSLSLTFRVLVCWRKRKQTTTTTTTKKKASSEILFIRFTFSSFHLYPSCLALRTFGQIAASERDSSLTSWWVFHTLRKQLRHL